jgi:hypothetical protein
MFYNSLMLLEETPGTWNKLGILFSQHMEHRPALPRGIAYLVWKISGTCNLKWLIVIGNGMLMLSWYILALAAKKLPTLHAMAFNLTTFFILCSLQSKENLCWATGALQNYSLIALALGAIYLCTQFKYGWAGLACLLAIGCAMSGFLVAVVLIIITCQQKKFTWALVYLVVAAGVAYIYRLNFIFYDVAALPGITVHRGFAAQFKYFMAFLGSSCTIQMIPLNRAIVTGTLLLVVTLIYNRNLKRWNIWTYLAIFVMLCALAGVSHRSVLGPYQALSERYKIFSEILVISLIAGTLGLARTHKKWLTPLLLAISATLFVAQFNYYQSYLVHRKWELKHGVEFFIVTKSPQRLCYPVPDRAATILVKSFEMHLFQLNMDD